MFNKASHTSVVLITCLLAVLAAGYLNYSIRPSVIAVPQQTVEEYVRWKAQYRPTLMMTPNEDDYRLRMFVANKARVERENEEYNRRVVEEKLPELSSPMYELNMFADLSDEEFQSQYLGGSMSSEEEEEVSPISELYERIPEIDLNEKPSLGISHSYNVYSQGSCGSCWAFASINLAERKYFTNTGNRAQFSQQQLVDCDRSNNGCSGGLISRGLNYINSNGVTTSSAYPYTNSVTNCKSAGKALNLKGSFNIQTYSFLFGGVATWISKNNYAGGRVNGQAIRFVGASDDVFSPKAGDCAVHVNHAITLIDYDIAANHITMLNSWGSGWGYRGTKKIRPCGKDNYAGSGAQFYTY